MGQTDAALSWPNAADRCWDLYGANLCLMSEVTIAAKQGTAIQTGRWLGDVIGDDSVLFTSTTNNNNFEAPASKLSGTRVGYCCLTLRQ